MALRANSTELFFICVANEEDAISDFYGILSVENKMTRTRLRKTGKSIYKTGCFKTERSLPWI